jgi:hypothetical protein
MSQLSRRREEIEGGTRRARSSHHTWKIVPNTTRAIIYVRTGEIHFQFRTRKVHCYFNTYTNPEQPKKNKARRRLQRLQRKLNTKLTDVKNIEEEIKEKSAQLIVGSSHIEGKLNI